MTLSFRSVLTPSHTHALTHSKAGQFQFRATLLHCPAALSLPAKRVMRGSGAVSAVHYAVYAWALVLTLLLPWLATQRTGPGGGGGCSVHEFHGGSPNGFGAGLGSCQCGLDRYCVCSPSLAVDAVVEVNSRYAASPSHDVSILLVVRRDYRKKKYAIPGIICVAIIVHVVVCFDLSLRCLALTVLQVGL